MNLNCENVRAELDAYSAGMLAGPVRADMDAHLAECAACRSELAEVRQLAGILRSMPVPAMPASLVGRLTQVAREQEARGRQRRGTGLTMAAMLAVGVGIGMLAATSRPRPDAVPAPLVAAAPTPALPAREPAPTPATARDAATLPREAALAPQVATGTPRHDVHRHRETTASRTVARASRRMDPPDGDISIAVNQVSTVSLEVTAARTMEGVEFVINIPEGFHLQGHEGERRIAWTGRLKEGRNRLNLRLEAPAGGAGTLEASVSNAGLSNTFKLRVRAVGAAAPVAPPEPDSSGTTAGPAAAAS